MAVHLTFPFTEQTHLKHNFGIEVFANNNSNFQKNHLEEVA